MAPLQQSRRGRSGDGRYGRGVAGGGPVPELSVLVNGTEIARFPLTPGRFEKTLTGPVAGGRNAIELKTTGHFILPSPDDRPASFRLVQMRLD